VGRYPQGGALDLDAAVAAARRAFDAGPWPRMAGVERARILTRVADGIREVADDLAYVEALESGKPISQAKGEITSSADLWEYAATFAAIPTATHNTPRARHARARAPASPSASVGMITPWNFRSDHQPEAAVRLGVGCTAVVKPASSPLVRRSASPRSARPPACRTVY
jgi:acyl-CoA reductase-like NAD-dependent aldehyde dehydrogenase